MKTEQFEGRSAQMRKDTPWLSSEDLDGMGDVTVTISSVYHHLGAEFDEGRKEDVFAVAFEGKAKQLVLNATNRKTLSRRFGTDVSAWKGKEISLFVKDGIRAFGKVRKGIRIR